MSPAVVPVVLATVREQVGGFLLAVITVYVLLIIAYILTQLYFGFGGRMPYSRAFSAVMEFLEQTVTPYLNVFRRFIPPLGPIDISPIVAILVLQLVGGTIARLIRG